MINDAVNSISRFVSIAFKVLVAAIVVLAVALVLASCSDPAPTTGKVVDKRFNPAHWEGGFETCSELDTWTKWECDEAGDSYWEDQHTWEHDSWDLKLNKCETNDKGEVKCREGWRRVSEYDHNRHNMGDYFPKVDEHMKGN